MTYLQRNPKRTELDPLEAITTLNIQIVHTNQAKYQTEHC